MLMANITSCDNLPNMNTVGKRIREQRKLLGLSQEDAATLCGWESQSRLSHYENDQRQPKKTDLEIIAKALRTTPEYLLFGIKESLSPPDRQNGDNEATISASPVKTVKIPLLELNQVEDWISGNLTSPVRSIKMYFTEDVVSKSSLFAIQAQGDAMESAQNIKLSICDGDYVVFDKDLKPVHKDIVLAKVEGKRSIRQYIQEGEELILKPLNTQYPPQPVEADTTILAVSVSIYRNYMR